MSRAVAYYRVSTAGQGRSGLGIAAQQRAVEELVRQRGFTLADTFTEVESGKRSDRPELAKALQLAKLTGAVLLIAKLDRLSRNAAFLLTLRDSGVRFVAADLPDANDLTIGVLAVIAQAEREAISRRTKEALAVVAARIERDGVHISGRTGRAVSRLGNPNGSACIHRRRQGSSVAVEASKRQAMERAVLLMPLIRTLQAEGITSLGGLAMALNDRGVLTPRGAKWHASSVRLLMQRGRSSSG